MSSALNISGVVSRGVTLAFSLFANLTKTGTYKKVTGYSQDLVTGVTALVIESFPVTILPLAYQSRDVNGTSIIYGDEKFLVASADIADLTELPSSGDWFEVDGERYDVQTVIAEPTQNLWTFHVRRQLYDPASSISSSADWGSLAAETSAEDWGDLTLAGSSEDWMN